MVERSVRLATLIRNNVIRKTFFLSLLAGVTNITVLSLKRLPK